MAGWQRAEPPEEDTGQTLMVPQIISVSLYNPSSLHTDFFPISLQIYSEYTSDLAAGFAFELTPDRHVYG